MRGEHGFFCGILEFKMRCEVGHFFSQKSKVKSLKGGKSGGNHDSDLMKPEIAFDISMDNSNSCLNVGVSKYLSSSAT